MHWLIFLISLVCGSARSASHTACTTHLRWKTRCLPCVAALAAASTLTLSSATNAYELSGTVRIADGAVPPLAEERALYLTVRPDGGTWNDGVRNFKSPPVLSKRIAASALTQGPPFDVSLDSKDNATPEGLAIGEDAWLSGKTPLLVTARLDSDGVAATRSEGDLVGQARLVKVDESWGNIEITVEGRGITGKFITRQNK